MDECINNNDDGNPPLPEYVFEYAREFIPEPVPPATQPVRPPVYQLPATPAPGITPRQWVAIGCGCAAGAGFLTWLETLGEAAALVVAL